VKPTGTLGKKERGKTDKETKRGTKEWFVEEEEKRGRVPVWSSPRLSLHKAGRRVLRKKKKEIN